MEGRETGADTRATGAGGAGGATTDGGMSVVGWGVNVCVGAVGVFDTSPAIAEVGTAMDGANAGLFIACNAVAGVGVVGRAGMEMAGASLPTFAVVIGSAGMDAACAAETTPKPLGCEGGVTS
jgi:hypothetical protein